MKRVIHHNAEAGITQYWEDLSDGGVILHTTQNIQELADRNKSEFNEYGTFNKPKEFRKMASIPMAVFNSPEFQKIRKDQPALKRWLNDRDNLIFRTMPGRV